MSMIPEITPDQIDDWFRIGKKTAKIKTVPKSSSGGRAIDPETMKPMLPQHQHVPHYKRKPDFHGGHDYAEEYQREEDEKLISRSSYFASNDTMSVVSSHLEALELDSTIAGTEVLPSDLAPENATQIYGVYNFHHRYDDRLPISKFKEQVVNTIESNQVTVIQGATGSGKTTQVAQYILDYYARQNQYCNIIVTQPRRIAAISIARRVCQERRWQLGTVCGYQVGLDREAGDDTRILYCTTGILLNKLINEKNMHKYTHVILDEVHERDQETDFSLLVVRKLLRTNSRHTKVVLMSATFDSEMFAQYFAMPVRDRLEQAPVVDVEGKPFNVNEYYAEDLIQLGPMPTLETIAKLNRNAPYKLPIAVRVCGKTDVDNYTNESGEAKQRVTLGLCDHSRAMKAVLYDISKLPLLKDGKSVMLVNVITKNNPVPALVITKQSRVLQTATVEAPEDFIEQAKRIVNPPPADEVQIRDIQSLPHKMMVSIRGYIAAEEIVRTVVVKGKDTEVRTIKVSDDRAAICKVSLWRNLAATKTTIGSAVKIMNVAVHMYNEEKTLNSTTTTKIEDVPEEELPTLAMHGHVIAFERKDEDSLVLILEMDEKFPSYTVNVSLLEILLSCRKEEVEEKMLKALPKEVQIQVPPLEESDPRISHEARNLAVELIQQFDKLEEKEQGLNDATGFAPIRGTVLMFLPGLAEITSLEEALFKLSAKHQLRLIPLHSTITMEEQAQVFSQPSTGFRKVILSTNIAESSITVPDIKYVIDFCLTKNLICDFDTNYTSLQVHWASKANCTQRKGRAGRVSNGRVYRLVTRHFYENRLPDYGTPEMQRCPLDKLILQVKVLDLGEPKAILALALSPPNLDDIERNILVLKEVGALSTQGYGNRHDGELTFVGRVLAELPVDTKIGKLLMFGHVFGLLNECLIIGAAMSLKSVFAQPFKLRLEAYRHKLEWANGSQSDSIAILNAYKTWERKKEQGEFKRTGGGGEAGWGKQYYLQIRRLKEIQVLIKDIEKRLMKFNIIKPQHAPRYVNKLTDDQEKLLLKVDTMLKQYALTGESKQVVLCGAFYPNYFVKGEIDEMESLKSLSGRNPLNTVMVKGLPANQGTLYKQVVEDMFRKCGANPKAYFEETRAYVEFPWRSNRRSKVHEGVYMALKMKQLRMPLFVDLYSQEEARAMLQRLQDAQDRVTQSGGLRTNRLTATGQVTEEPGSNRVAVHVSPPDPAKDVISISITEVIECGHFWAQYGEEENCRALYQVQEALNKDRGYSLKPLSGVVRVGVFCVAPYMDETLEYYRARIQSIQNKFDESIRAYRECVEVFFVDYGNSAEMRREELRELPSHLLRTPFQAFECRLIKIRPSPIKCPDGKWTYGATKAFTEMVLNHKLIARPFSILHGVLRVDLIHITQQYGQFYVGPKLVEMGFADEAEESTLSKQNHEQRAEEYMKARNLLGQGAQKGTVLGAPRADWLNVSLGASGDLGARHKGCRVNLTGPTNPYELSFYNMTNIGRLRATKIEPDSVNSVNIDDEPHDPHQRMMVSGFVGLNPNGSSVVARDTTVMPPIPGLPALILLMFTPVAEFRVDPQKIRYIGALCGLGTEPVYGQSVLPDHDIELPFDVKFNHEDIYKINGIRMAINFAIGNQTQVAAWGPDAVCKIQDSARKKIMDLIQKRREPCEVITPQRMYMWNQVDQDDILPHNVDVGDAAQLLNLHSGIQLEGGEDSDIPEIAKQKEIVRKHLQFLRQVVKSNTRRTPTLCELCNVSCPTTQLLALHLETQMHKRNEDNFR